MFIGIDLGTSSVKTILIDHDQNIICSTNSSLSIQSSKDGYSEQNPEDWINATLDCFTKLQSLNPKNFKKQYLLEFQVTCMEQHC